MAPVHAWRQTDDVDLSSISGAGGQRNCRLRNARNTGPTIVKNLQRPLRLVGSAQAEVLHFREEGRRVLLKKRIASEIHVDKIVLSYRGRTHIEGGLGLIENRFHIPLVGTFLFEWHNVSRVYLLNFLTMGSWNLTWVLVFGALLLAVIPPFGKAKKVILLFVVLFIATQAFIFGLTDRGSWAAYYTAINRLPLQFLPALLFSVAVITRSVLAGTQVDNEAAHE